MSDKVNIDFRLIYILLFKEYAKKKKQKESNTCEQKMMVFSDHFWPF